MSSNIISFSDSESRSNFSLDVNSKGDGFALEPNNKTPNEIQKEALKCKTHAQVLDFLQNKEEELRSCYFFHDLYKDKRDCRIVRWLNKNWKDTQHPEEVEIHPGGKCPFGEKKCRCNIHIDNREKLIEFVKLRIFEKENIFYRIFNKVEKALGKTLQCLNHYAKIPVLGAIPASLKAVIGCLQSTAAVALMIIFGISSIFSENAKVIFVRSENHFFYGPINVISACFQAIPFGGLLFSKLPRML